MPKAYEEQAFTAEGYGPGGTAVMIACVSAGESANEMAIAALREQVRSEPGSSPSTRQREAIGAAATSTGRVASGSNVRQELFRYLAIRVHVLHARKGAQFSGELLQAQCIGCVERQGLRRATRHRRGQHGMPRRLQLQPD